MCRLVEVTPVVGAGAGSEFLRREQRVFHVTRRGDGEVAVSQGTEVRRLAHEVLDRLPLSLRTRLQAAHYVRLLRRMRLEAEPDLVVARALVTPGSTLMDVGANIGVYTRWLSELVGEGGRVIALEPLAETFATLRRIADRFGWSNVTLVDAAASDRPGDLLMQVPVDDRGIRNHCLARIGGRTEDACPVRALTIDKLAGSDSVTFIKVDVEGHELPCLRGGLETIRRCQPALLVEINRDSWDQASGGVAVTGLLRGEGYAVWSFDGKRLQQWNGVVDGVNYWFLRPSHIAAIRMRHPGLVAVDVTRYRS